MPCINFLTFCVIKWGVHMKHFAAFQRNMVALKKKSTCVNHQHYRLTGSIYQGISNFTNSVRIWVSERYFLENE